MIVINNVNGSSFNLNGTRYIKNFMIIKQGSTNVAIHNAYDTKYQLLASTHYSQISVNNQVYTNQADLMASLAPVLFANSYIGGNVTSTSQLVNDGADGINPFVTTADLPQANKIVNQTGYYLTDNSLTMVAEWVWLIANQQYHNSYDVNITIPFAAEGKQRIDLIVATSGSTFQRIAGEEVDLEDNAIAPPVPINTIQATLIVVGDGDEAIEIEPTPVGDLYLDKASESIRFLNYSGVIDDYVLKGHTNHFFDGTITEIRSASYIGADIGYKGKRLRFINRQAISILFKHNAGSGIIKFDLIGGVDYELKPNETLSFILKDDYTFLQVSNKSLEDNFVHLTGDEIIDGSKKINQDLILNQDLKMLFDENKYIDISAEEGILKANVDESPLFEIQRGSIEIFNTADFKARIQNFDLTSTDRTYQLPDNDGTFALLSDITGSTGGGDLQSVTDNGNTTSTNIVANGGIQGSSDYANYQLMAPYYNDMKSFSFNVTGDGTDYSTSSGLQFYMNPEEGMSLNRYNYDVGTSSILSFHEEALYMSAGNTTGASLLYLTPSELSLNTGGGGNANLRATTLTDSRTFEFPDNSGTIALLSDIIGSSGIPLTGTIEGSPVTGNVELSDSVLFFNDNISFDGEYSSIDLSLGKVSVKSSNAFSSKQTSLYSASDNISLLSEDGSGYNSSILLTDKVSIFDNHPSSRGLTGEQDFTANIGDLDFVQKKYVDQKVADSRPYKVYTALLNQNGSDAPVPIILENTFEDELIWTRNWAGFYQVDISGGFDVNKSWTTGKSAGGGTMFDFLHNGTGFNLYTDYDNAMNNNSIEIRLYN